MVSLSTESVQEWFDVQLDITAKNELSNTLNNPDIIGKYFSELDQEQQDLVLGAYLQMARPEIRVPELEEDVGVGGYFDDNQPNSDKGWKSFPTGTSHFESKADEHYGMGTPAGDIIWKYFNEVHSMDQDDVFCKICGEQMTEPVRIAGINGDGMGGLAQQQVFFDHLKQEHGLPYDPSTESKTTEDDYEISQDSRVLGDKEGARWWKEDNTNYEQAQHNEANQGDASEVDIWTTKDVVGGDNELSPRFEASSPIPQGATVYHVACPYCGKLIHSAYEEELMEDFYNHKKEHGNVSYKDEQGTFTSLNESKANETKMERGNGTMKVDGKNVIKIWESMQGWYWYAIEDQGEYTGINQHGDEVQAHAWFGFVTGDFDEWGSWDSIELEKTGMVWDVPKSNWGWTGRQTNFESKANEGKEEDYERIRELREKEEGAYATNEELEELLKLEQKHFKSEESKANEESMFPSTKGKTYTCGKCGKVGTDFGEMARELCPADVDASHQIPIFGDRLKHPDLVESKATEGVCPRCKGKGITYKAVVTGITKTRPDGDGMGAIKIECPECDGTGEISTNRTAGGYDQAPEDRSVNTQGRRHSFGWSNVYPSSESKANEEQRDPEDTCERCGKNKTTHQYLDHDFSQGEYEPLEEASENSNWKAFNNTQRQEIIDLADVSVSADTEWEDISEPDQEDLSIHLVSQGALANADFTGFADEYVNKIKLNGLNVKNHVRETLRDSIHNWKKMDKGVRKEDSEYAGIDKDVIDTIVDMSLGNIKTEFPEEFNKLEQIGVWGLGEAKANEVEPEGYEGRALSVDQLVRMYEVCGNPDGWNRTQTVDDKDNANQATAERYVKKGAWGATHQHHRSVCTEYAGYCATCGLHLGVVESKANEYTTIGGKKVDFNYEPTDSDILDRLFSEYSETVSKSNPPSKANAIKYLVDHGIQQNEAEVTIYQYWNAYDWKMIVNGASMFDDVDYIDGSDVPTSGVYESKANEDGMYSNFGTKSNDESWSVLTVASDLIFFSTRKELDDYVKDWDRKDYSIHPPKYGNDNPNAIESRASEDGYTTPERYAQCPNCGKTDVDIINSGADNLYSYTYECNNCGNIFTDKTRFHHNAMTNKTPTNDYYNKYTFPSDFTESKASEDWSPIQDFKDDLEGQWFDRSGNSPYQNGGNVAVGDDNGTYYESANAFEQQDPSGFKAMYKHWLKDSGEDDEHWLNYHGESKASEYNERDEEGQKAFLKDWANYKYQEQDPEGLYMDVVMEFGDPDEWDGNQPVYYQKKEGMDDNDVSNFVLQSTSNYESYAKEEDNSDEWLHRMIYGDDEESEKLFSSRTAPSKKFSKKDNKESRANEYLPDHFDLDEDRADDIMDGKAQADLVICRRCGKKYDLEEYEHEDLNKHLLEIHNIRNIEESKANEDLEICPYCDSTRVVTARIENKRENNQNVGVHIYRCNSCGNVFKEKSGEANENVASKLAYYYQKDVPNDWNDNQVSNEAEKILEETYGIKPKKEVVKVEAKESLSIVQQKIVDRKLDGVRNESIIHELKIWDDMNEEQAKKAVETTEIPLQDSIAYTLFNKKYTECNENEIQELKIYAGESRVKATEAYSDPECSICGKVMHNSYEQNDDEDAMRDTIIKHYKDYHLDILEAFGGGYNIDMEMEKQLAKTTYNPNNAEQYFESKKVNKHRRGF